MLNDNNSFEVDSFLNDFKANYGDNIQEPTGDNVSYVFKVGGEMAAVAYLDVLIPAGDIKGTAQYAYNWQTALEDTKDYKSHLIVSLM